MSEYISRLATNADLNAMVKALKKAGAPLVENKDQEGHVIELKDQKGKAVFWAMSHSSKKNYLVRYLKTLFTVIGA